jgi:phosphatidylserine decarboxylase
MKNNNNIILQEGYKSILIALTLSVLASLFICDTLAIIGYIITFVLLFAYRNPNINFYNKDEKNILAPIDGKITAIDYSKNKYKVYIDVSLCDTHILRAPKDAPFKIKSFINGMNLCSNTYKAKLLNTRATLKFDDIKVKLLSGMCNPNITLYDTLENVEATQAIGVFLHGTIVVEIPKEYELQIALNDKIKAGQSVLA